MKDWADRLRGWALPEEWRKIVTVDAHVEGEPLRVVLGGYAELEGDTLLVQRGFAKECHDGLRKAVMWEPRGHADMYGAIVVPPVSSRADIGVLFTHNEGYSTMCGHGIIGVTTVLLQCGVLEATEPETLLGIDTPAGFVEARAKVHDDLVQAVSFINVASFVSSLDREVEVPGVGAVHYDLAFGGAFYAYVDAERFGLRLVPEEYARIVELGRAIKSAVQEADSPCHPLEEDLGFLYGTIFVGPAHSDGSHSRNVCVFADGEVDRCPTGTGVSGRLAIHHERGEVAEDEPIVIESILGTTFACRILGTGQVGDQPAITSEVTGRAFVTGRNELIIDSRDPLAEGFIFR